MVGSMATQMADMVWENEPRVLHLAWQAAGREEVQGLVEFLKSQTLSSVTHFLQPRHTYSNQTIAPNSVIPCWPSIDIYEPTGGGGILIQRGRQYVEY